MILAGADVNKAVDMRNFTPIFSAVKQGHHQIVKVLLSAGAKFDIRTASRTQLIGYAVEKGNFKVIKALLNAGVSLNVTTSLVIYDTPLAIAARSGRIDIIRALRGYGAVATKLALSQSRNAETREIVLKLKNIWSRRIHSVYQLSWLRNPVWKRSLTDLEEQPFEGSFSLQDLAWLAIALKPGLMGIARELLPPVVISQNEQKPKLMLVSKQRSDEYRPIRGYLGYMLMPK